MVRKEPYNRQIVIEAAEILKNGGLVAFPTETVYGLGASALNPRAVAKIFEVKDRPSFDPLIVHIADLEMFPRLSDTFNQKYEVLIEKFWPGPLTLVVAKSDIVPKIVTAGLETVAIRMPANQIALELIRTSGVPIAAPSANIFGCLSPTTAEHVAEQLGDKIDLIIDGGKTDIGIESTVLDITNSPTVLRIGALPVEEIEVVIGKVEIGKNLNKIRSPGQFHKHYAPRIPLKIIANGNFKIENNLRVGLLAFKQTGSDLPFKFVEVLSIDGDLKEAACNLFEALHRLERADIDIIYAEPVPEIGLGRAIMDRLRKAQGEENG